MYITEPSWLWLLVLPGALAAYHVFGRRRANTRWSNQVALQRAKLGSRRLWRHLAAVCALTVMVLLCVAATRPAFASPYQEKRSAVMLVVDVSTSMTANDVAPTRLEAAQNALTEMVKTTPAELNIGLVTLADNAKLVVPPTQNRAALLESIEGLQAESGGTATGEGVIQAASALDAVAGFGSSEQLPARIILVSDGVEEIQEGERDILAAADVAVKAAYPVYTINFGTEGGTMPNGQPIRDDPEALAALATATSGDAFSAETGDDLAATLQSIPGAVLEREHEAVTPLIVRYIAIVLLALLAGYFMYNTRRT